jgi:hypothetical protein
MASQLDGQAKGYTTLSSTLWRLREVLDQLLFKVFETQLILQSGQTRWLAKASRELDAALQEVRHVEVMRAVETIGIADQLQLPADITLSRLIDTAPPPWETILFEHRDALLSLSADLHRATADLPEVGPPAAPSTAQARLAASPDAPEAVFDDDVDMVSRFLAETLARAPQASLTAFLS